MIRGDRVLLPGAAQPGTVVEVLLRVQTDLGWTCIIGADVVTRDESGAGPYRCPVCGLRAWGYEGQVDEGRPCRCTTEQAAWKDGDGHGRGMHPTWPEREDK